MPKAILMSIRPEWVAKILNREKTIEIRTTRPRCELPVDVYIYCTKGAGLQKFGNKYFAQKGQYPVRNGKVVAKFTLRNVHKFDAEQVKNTFFKVRNSCLTNRELTDYAQGKDLYGWNISDLVIFDKPKELSEFGLERAPQSWQFVEVEE